VTVVVQADISNAMKAIAREVVPLFQRDAPAKGADRAVWSPLGATPPARRAASAATATVDRGVFVAGLPQAVAIVICSAGPSAFRKWHRPHS
jgi:hypothetical protein